MSFPASNPLPSLPAICPEISADLMDGMCAAVPRPAGAGPGDGGFGRDATLISQMDALHPRDLEETMLATQVVVAYHGAMACLAAATRLDPASREASRLRRDGVAQQRALIALLRALHKSLARPVIEDPDTCVPRPTVPTRPSPQARPQPARTVAAAVAQDEEAPPRRPDPFENDPDLRRLRDQWDTLPRWENMTMEQRRATWGYKPEQPKDGSPGNGQPAP